MRKPTFAIAVTFEIHDQHVEAFRKRIVQQANDSLAREPGCCQFDVLVDESQRNVIFLYETYLDAQAFEEHKRTAHFADYDRTVAPWIISKHVRRLNHIQ